MNWVRADCCLLFFVPVPFFSFHACALACDPDILRQFSNLVLLADAVADLDWSVAALCFGAHVCFTSVAGRETLSLGNCEVEVLQGRTAAGLLSNRGCRGCRRKVVGLKRKLSALKYSIRR